jgi:hypothetical protein
MKNMSLKGSTLRRAIQPRVALLAGSLARVSDDIGQLHQRPRPEDTRRAPSTPTGSRSAAICATNTSGSSAARIRRGRRAARSISPTWLVALARRCDVVLVT